MLLKGSTKNIQGLAAVPVFFTLGHHTRCPRPEAPRAEALRAAGGCPLRALPR